MSTPTVADYSWGRPNLGELRSLGYVGVMRYLSWDSTKNLSRDEVTAIHAAGLWVGLNWEGTGNWAELGQGAHGGRAAGAEAGRQARALGAPTSVPIFVSADYDVTPDQHATIGAYLDAFADASGYPVGIYGEGQLLNAMLAAGHARFGWNTNATGWGGVSAQAVLLQKLPAHVAGADIDPNVLIGDPRAFAWGATHAPPPSAPNPEDLDMEPAELRRHIAEVLRSEGVSGANDEAKRNGKKLDELAAAVKQVQIYAAGAFDRVAGHVKAVLDGSAGKRK